MERKKPGHGAAKMMKVKKKQGVKPSKRRAPSHSDEGSGSSSNENGVKGVMTHMAANKGGDDKSNKHFKRK